MNDTPITRADICLAIAIGLALAALALAWFDVLYFTASL